ncbi:MAG: cation:dicarboxylase symporter family transporter, partial [Oscillospiraceae bacterium]|nr:cation:dicarboxylase symporter family transporter [Oscillospiraceae bacterium]
ISSSLCSFGVPLGMVMHKPVAAVYNLLLVFYFAARYGVDCSVSWIVVAALVSAVLAIATPPIPGGGAAAYTILFMQLGIPMEALAVALTIDILTDFPVTAFEMFVLPFTLINVSSGLAMIDADTLRSRS